MLEIDIVGVAGLAGDEPLIFPALGSGADAGLAH
jgi:hypothetical protein